MRSPSMRHWGQLVVLPVVLVVVVWVITADSGSIYFPPLSEVLGALGSGVVEGSLLSDLGYSMRNLILGLALASLGGGLLGMVIGIHAHTREVLMPLLAFLRAMPHAAFVPAVILTLGIGAAPKILLIAFSTCWPVLLNTINGVRGIHPAVMETAAVYRIPWHLQLLKVVMPGALPQFLAGLRISVSVGLVIVVISELYGSAEGIGYFILRSSQNFAVVDTWAGTVLIGIVGYLLSLLLLLVEHALLGWYEQRAPRSRPSRAGSGLLRQGPRLGSRHERRQPGAA
ncbi:ABC transporter permease [Nocardioides sp.]|uniref:ABC transporter permease n=1 Tax=Nocardioides sp. TaxID=35761 RepID=UPI0039E6F7B3